MLDEGKINARQAGFLMFSFLMGSAILLVPGIVTSFAQQNGWLSVLIAALLGVGFVLVHTTLGLLFPQQSIIQYSETLLGKWIGKTVGILYIWFFFHLGTLVTRNISDFVITLVLPRTPLVVVSGSLLGVIAYAIRGGIETLGRVNELMLPVRETVVFLVILLSLIDMKLDNLTPFMGDGIIPVLKGSIPVASFPFGEIVLFTMLLPNISNIRKVKTTYTITVILGGIVIATSVLTSILALSPSIIARTNFPLQSLISSIELADFFTNLDALGMLLWVSSVFVKAAVCYYCTAIGIAQWFRLTDYKSIVTPVGILMLIFSMTVFKNYIQEAAFASMIWPFYSIPFVILFPLLMLLVAKIRRLDGRVTRT